MLARAAGLTLLSLLCLVVLIGPASAAGAWVLWVNMTRGLAPPAPAGEWHVLSGHEQLEECRQTSFRYARGKYEQLLDVWGNAGARIREHDPSFGLQRNETPDQAHAREMRDSASAMAVMGGYFEMKTARGGPMVFNYICLPDTVDPRR